MGWLMTLIIGGIVGWLASIVMKTNAQMGIVANVLVGVVGSVIGTFLAGLLGIPATTGVLHLLAAFGGAVLLLLILGKVGVFKTKHA
jgi:uncharacterized membrane protein YeaQ/YmgE (transglycosylase-associated protein family)